MPCISNKTKVMKAEMIMQSNLLDIIFENRNKDYGAYTLTHIAGHFPRFVKYMCLFVNIS